MAKYTFDASKASHSFPIVPRVSHRPILPAHFFPPTSARPLLPAHFFTLISIGFVTPPTSSRPLFFRPPFSPPTVSPRPRSPPPHTVSPPSPHCFPAHTPRLHLGHFLPTRMMGLSVDVVGVGAEVGSGRVAATERSRVSIAVELRWEIRWSWGARTHAIWWPARLQEHECYTLPLPHLLEMLYTQFIPIPPPLTRWKCSIPVAPPHMLEMLPTHSKETLYTHDTPIRCTHTHTHVIHFRILLYLPR